MSPHCEAGQLLSRKPVSSRPGEPCRAQQLRALLCPDLLLCRLLSDQQL